jgi:hypothetical protein
VPKVALLDVNVLVALFFPDHVHHELAHDWFAEHRRHGWATCPITENGFIRIACQQPAADGVLRVADVLAHLRRFCASAGHRSWQDTVSLQDTSLFAAQYTRGHGQITDVYLLGLATKRNGCLATFDHDIPLQAVRGATPDTLQVISASP